MALVPNKPAKNLMENLSGAPVDIHKGMKMSIEMDMSGTIVQLGDRSNLTGFNDIWKIRVGEHLVFRGQLDGTVADKLEEPKYWKDQVIVPPNFEM